MDVAPDIDDDVVAALTGVLTRLATVDAAVRAAWAQRIVRRFEDTRDGAIREALAAGDFDPLPLAKFTQIPMPTVAIARGAINQGR